MTNIIDLLDEHEHRITKMELQPDLPISRDEFEELRLMVTEIHDFVQDLKGIGTRMAESGNPMAALMRGMIPEH